MRWPIAILVALISPLALAQQPPRAGVPTTTPAAGFRSADVEGQTMRYQCQGVGSPTVIIEQGGGVSLETVFSWKSPVGWAALAPKIASLTRVCVYDRVGLGRSSQADRSRTSFDVARELRALLARENVTPPYVLAGQSLGGMNALAFANQNRDEVVGVVLIDSSHPRQLQRINAVLPPRRDDEPEVLRGFRDGPDRTAMGGEWFDFGKNADRFANNMSIGNIPLIVLTAAPQPPDDKSPLPREWHIAIEPVHQQLQRELTRASTDSKHIVARKAGHNIQLDEPELVLDAITSLVMRARANAPNAPQTQAQDSLIGDHPINLKLRNQPVADVVRLLSARSKGVQAQSGLPAWEVDGLDKLDGLFVETAFVLTPVDQVVAEVLGCIGFSYRERGNRIEIVEAERKLSAAECPHITVATNAPVGDGHSAPSPQKTYSWRFESISAAEFLELLADAARSNIVRTHTAEADAYLADKILRVDVSNMTEPEVLGNMLACIGWTYEKTDAGYLVYDAAGRPLRGECKGFRLL